MPKIVTTNMHITALSIVGEFQFRKNLNDEKVVEYSTFLQEDTSFDFPAIEVTKLPDGKLVITDGVHRCKAYQAAGRESIPCVVEAGTKEDAIWRAAAANKGHGLPRTMADKRRAVVAALRHKNYQSGSTSMRDIAKHVGVSHTMVQDAARRLELKREKKAGEPETSPDIVEYPPEVAEAIEKIGVTNPAAAEALLTGTIIKAHDEIIRYSQYDDIYQSVLAPLFFGRRMSLAAAMQVVDKRPTEDSTLRDAINFARMQQEDIQLAFDNNTVLIQVTLLENVKDGKQLVEI